MKNIICSSTWISSPGGGAKKCLKPPSVRCLIISPRFGVKHKTGLKPPPKIRCFLVQASTWIACRVHRYQLVVHPTNLRPGVRMFSISDVTQALVLVFTTAAVSSKKLIVVLAIPRLPNTWRGGIWTPKTYLKHQTPAIFGRLG